MAYQPDETDRELLAILRRNARTPVADIARRLKVARTTAQARLDRLEREGVIRGYTLRMEEGALRMMRAFVLIQVEPRSTAEVLAALAKMDAVESLHTTSGRYDMAAQVAAPGPPELDRALDRIGLIRGVRSIETLIQLTTRLDRRL